MEQTKEELGYQEQDTEVKENAYFYSPDIMHIDRDINEHQRQKKELIGYYKALLDGELKDEVLKKASNKKESDLLFMLDPKVLKTKRELDFLTGKQMAYGAKIEEFETPFVINFSAVVAAILGLALGIAGGVAIGTALSSVVAGTFGIWVLGSAGAVAGAAIPLVAYNRILKHKEKTYSKKVSAKLYELLNLVNSKDMEKIVQKALDKVSRKIELEKQYREELLSKQVFPDDPTSLSEGVDSAKQTFTPDPALFTNPNESKTYSIGSKKESNNA